MLALLLAEQFCLSSTFTSSVNVVNATAVAIANVDFLAVGSKVSGLGPGQGFRVQGVGI